MKYEGVIAILDGQPDSLGDILSKNVQMPIDRVLVTNGFDGPPIGFAAVKVVGDSVMAEIDIDTKIMPPEAVEMFKGVIGGSITKRNGCSIEGWILKDVGLTQNPCDKRLPNLKRKL